MLFRYFQSKAEDIEVITASTGADGVRLGGQVSPDLVLLDLSLGDIDGFEVMRRFKENVLTAKVPVILLTAVAEARDLLRSAAAGLKAEDFIEKDMGPSYILGRTRAVLSRSTAAGKENEWLLERGGLRIDLRNRHVTLDGTSIKLGRRRFELLCALARSRDGMPSPLLQSMIWGSADNPNTLSKTVNRLRKDLLAAGRDPIVSIPGGYKLS